MPQFDSETCPICGINLSDSISVERIPLIELKFDNQTSAADAVKRLDEHGIKSRYSSKGKEKILIAETNLEKAKSLLNS